MRLLLLATTVAAMLLIVPAITFYYQAHLLLDRVGPPVPAIEEPAESELPTATWGLLS